MFCREDLLGRECFCVAYRAEIKGGRQSSYYVNIMIRTIKLSQTFQNNILLGNCVNKVENDEV